MPKHLIDTDHYRDQIRVGMPYRIDITNPSEDALDRLVVLGALDAEAINGGFAVLMPDGTEPDEVRRAVDADTFIVSPAKARDDGSVWILSPRPVQAGSILLVPSSMP